MKLRLCMCACLLLLAVKAPAQPSGFDSSVQCAYGSSSWINLNSLIEGGQRHRFLSNGDILNAILEFDGLPSDLHGLKDNLYLPGGTLPKKQLESIMQTSATMIDGVLIFSLDRSDLDVIGPDGIPLASPVDPTSEFFFEPLANGQAFLDSNIAFTVEELPRVTDAITSTPLKFEALHQHLIGEKPQLFHYHIRGRGKATDLATWVMKVVRATGTPLPQPPPPMVTPLPYKKLAAILGGVAEIESDGVVTVYIPRREIFIIDGVVQRHFMDVLHTVTFQPLSADGTQALVVPDYALLGQEVDPVQKFSRKLGFELHCIYNQQTQMYPQLFFNHQFKTGNTLDLARQVRKVIDLTARK